MKRMKILAMALIAAMAVTAVGCAQKLSEGFDEDVVFAAAEDAIEAFSSGDYQAVNDMCRDDLKPLLSVDTLSDASEQVLSDMGAYVGIKSETAVGKKDAKTQMEYAIVVASAEYENGARTYTITFDLDMNLTGFYVK